MSWGLGAGLVINGDIFTGKSGFSGEFGHFNVFDNEILCHCGKAWMSGNGGFWSCFASEAGAMCASGKQSTTFPNASYMAILSLTLDEIISATNKEDLLCIELVEEIGQKIGTLSGWID